jgi:hypothetical protein
MKSYLVQPILSIQREPGEEASDALNLNTFISLLKEEEDYFDGDQNNTKLMITRLRKIFYDQWGWNSELIRGAASIEGRYLVSLVDDATEHTKAVTRYTDNEYQPKHRLVTYRPDDRVYGNTRVGQSPLIYKNDHQEVLLPTGYYCDMAHILAGLDAFNHPQIVSPLPAFLSFLDKLFPHVDSNMDIVTWLGDIASSAGDFMFGYLNNNKKPVSEVQEQHYINVDAPGSDMLGDIEPYVIAKHYNVSSNNGMRVTEILEEYYLGSNSNPPLRDRRFSIFCESIGLKGWNGTHFSNEQEWLEYYKIQLRDNTCFQVFSLTTESFKSVWLLLKIWFNGFKDILKLELLLEIFIKALKEELIKENSK